MSEQIYYIEQSRHKSLPPTCFSFFRLFNYEDLLEAIAESEKLNRVVSAYFRIKLKINP